MKQIAVTILMVFITCCVYAQTQHGFVRTIGTYERRGKPISGASVKVKGNTNSVVSDHNGMFSVPMIKKKEGEAYQLLNVIKSGYEFADRDFLSRTFAYSTKNVLEVVMISTIEMNKARQELEDRTYRTIQNGYDKKVAALNEQLKTGKVTSVAYENKLKELQDQFDRIDAIVADMAEHYVRTDYDKLDSLDAVINSCIVNGELDRADLLIAQKGSLDDRIAAYQRHASSNKEARLMLDKLSEELTLRYENYAKERDDIAGDLYNKYFIAVSHFDNNLAREHLELRAELDTTNVDWQLDLVEFLTYNYSDFENLRKYSERAMRNAINQYGEHSLLTAKSYNWLGNYYMLIDRMTEAEYYHNASLQIRKEYNDADGISRSYLNMSVVYESRQMYDKALECIGEARKYCLLTSDPNIRLMVGFFMNEASVFQHKEDYVKAGECLHKGIELYERSNLKAPDILVGLYNGLGNVASDIDSSLYYYRKALDVIKETKQTDSGKRLKILQNINYTLRRDSTNVDMAIDSYREIIPQIEAIFGTNHKDVAHTWATFGSLLIGRGMVDEAEAYCQRAYDFYESRQDTLNMARELSDLGYICAVQNQKEKSLELYGKSEKYHQRSGVTPSSTFYMNYAATYYQVENYNKAAEYYTIAHTKAKEENISKGKIASYAQYVAETYEKIGNPFYALQWHITAANEYNEAGYDGNGYEETKKIADHCFVIANWLLSQNDTLSAANYFGAGAKYSYKLGDVPGTYEGAYRAAYAYQRTNDIAQASTFYDLGINACALTKGKMNAEGVNLCNSAAYMYLSINDVDKAIIYLDRAISIDPNEPNIYDSKGEMLLKLGKNDEALKMWKKVIELKPNFLDDYPDGTELSNGLKKLGLIE